MNITYKYIIVVPAGAATVDRGLIRGMAEQIAPYLENQKVVVLSMPEGTLTDTTQTAEMLTGQLVRREINATHESRRSNLETTGKPTEEETLAMIRRALEPMPEADILIIVCDQIHAERSPRLVLCEQLNASGILQELDMAFNPGDVGIVNCKARTRTGLYAQKTTNWATPKHRRWLPW